MRSLHLLALVGLGLSLACGGGKSECGEGTVEVDGECVADDGDNGSDNGTENGAENGTESGAETTGDTDVDPGQDPEIISFTTNTTTMVVGESIVLSVLATDPQGIEDLIGGALLSSTGATYGTLAAESQEGAYAYTVAWSDIRTLETIADFDATGSLSFTVVMYDQDGHDGREVLTVPLRCGGNNQGYCGGACVSLSETDEHCGTCAHDCDALGGYCDEGACWDRFYTCDQIRSLEATSCDGVCAGSKTDAVCRESTGHYSDAGYIYADAECNDEVGILGGCSTDFTEAGPSWYVECYCALPL